MTDTSTHDAAGGLIAGEGLVVLCVKYPMISKAMVELLRTLLSDSAQSGVVVSLDRPSEYISRLLERHGVPQDRLLYIDAVARISGETLPQSGRADELPTPFCINLLSDFVTLCGPRIKEKRSGFLLVDNLGALTPYVSDECLKRFLESLVALGASVPGLRCIFVLDREHHRQLYELVKRMGAREVSL
ncbi:MAG: hypothetical protein ACUVV6_01275 [Thermoplasmatota archaeon]